jgi:2-polyprenyl-3-methyl-5-hydroxy-6-metoxy-1,4-benzoquinol methylase
MNNSKKTTIKSYDDTATEYYRVVSRFELLPEIKKFAKEVIKKGKILDLGCGPGHHSNYFSKQNFKVTGIDLSLEMIRLAKKEFKDVDFKVMDMSNLDFDINSFDGIWASASLLHVPKYKIKSLLRKLNELLVNDGILYISLKQGIGSEMINDVRYGGVNKFYVFYQPEEIENLLKSIGFKIIEIKLKGKRTSYDTNSWIHVFCKK